MCRLAMRDRNLLRRIAILEVGLNPPEAGCPEPRHFLPSTPAPPTDLAFCLSPRQTNLAAAARGGILIVPLLAFNATRSEVFKRSFQAKGGATRPALLLRT